MSDINDVIFDLTSLRDGPWDLTQVDRAALTSAIHILERSAGTWVPVTERLPNKEAEVITTTLGDDWVNVNWFTHGRWSIGKPTHWLEVKLPIPTGGE